jgi:hypothetical protein
LDILTEREQLAQRYAPILVMWPEIPARPGADHSLRDRFARRRPHSASRTVSGAHITRDFYPRDVRLILGHSQAWEPRSPLPFVPVAFAMAYRDYAKFFFWPNAAVIIIALLIAAFAQLLTLVPRIAIEIGTLLFVAVLFLTSIRSPVLVPTNYWHHINNIVAGAGLAVLWWAVLGRFNPYVAAGVAMLSLLPWLTSLMLKAISGRTDMIVFSLEFLRRLALRAVGKEVSRGVSEYRYARFFRGVKAAHEYSEDAELFFRHPHSGEAIYRADRRSHWAAYSRILSETEYPVIYYARVLEPDTDGITVVQYWFCYYFHDWANVHEGDWETVAVMIEDGVPVAVACSQHEGGEYRDWRHVEHRGDRPVLYVAAGSHAVYFDSGTHLTEREVAGLQLTSLDASLLGGEVLDFVDFTPTKSGESTVIDNARLLAIPDPDPETGLWGHQPHAPGCRGDCEYNYEWLNFPGHWGAAAFGNRGASGPAGPVYSGLRWDDPRMWAESACEACKVCGDKSMAVNARPVRSPRRGMHYREIS